MNEGSSSLDHNARAGSQSDRPLWNINPHSEERSFSRNYNPDLKDSSNVTKFIIRLENATNIL